MPLAASPGPAACPGGAGRHVVTEVTDITIEKGFIEFYSKVMGRIRIMEEVYAQTKDGDWKNAVIVSVRNDDRVKIRFHGRDSEEDDWFLYSELRKIVVVDTDDEDHPDNQGMNKENGLNQSQGMQVREDLSRILLCVH
jgi:hypothetical protein